MFFGAGSLCSIMRVIRSSKCSAGSSLLSEKADILLEGAKDLGLAGS